jgi:hypothetical protein
VTDEPEGVKRVHDVAPFEITDELSLELKKGRSILIWIDEEKAGDEEGASAHTWIGLDAAVSLRDWLDRAIAVMNGSDPGIPVYRHEDGTEAVLREFPPES